MLGEDNIPTAGESLLEEKQSLRLTCVHCGQRFIFSAWSVCLELFLELEVRNP